MKHFSARVKFSRRTVVAVVMLVLGAAITYTAIPYATPLFAVQFAPEKQAAKSRTDASLKADDLFWKTFHGGEYERIPDALTALTAAYLDNPADSVTAAHTGWLHIWRLSERARLDSVPPTITDDAVMARKYFQEAVRLNPADARYLGFLGSTMLAEGSIHQDEKLMRQGYFTLRDSISAWPEFNLFTAGYVMSGRPADSSQFREGLDWQWRTLDECVLAKVDRQNPDYSQYMSLYTTEGEKRVCWNSWIAPHNFEGFLLNMGDMLVKSGDWQTARKIYANARLSADYPQWKFVAVLEDRIKEAQGNVALFNALERPNGKAKNPIMLNSQFSCMACHQQ